MLALADIDKILNFIKCDVAESDSISIRMVGNCLPIIFPQICRIINCCLEKGYLTKTLKEAIIKSMPKITKPVAVFLDLLNKGLLPVFSKI